MNLHLKDGIVKHYVYQTKIFGITISSQRTTTISKKEGTDDCFDDYQEERSNDRNQDAKDKVESTESSEKYAKLMGLNEEESIEWVARQKDKPSGDKGLPKMAQHAANQGANQAHSPSGGRTNGRSNEYDRGGHGRGRSSK